MNTATAPDAIQEQLAAARSTLTDDVHSAATNIRELTDWRHHFRAHTLLISGAAATLGYVLTPRRRRRIRAGSQVDKVNSAKAPETAESRQPVEQTNTPVGSRNGFRRALIEVTAATLVEEALIFGARRGREFFGHRADDRTEDPATKPKQPVSGHTPPDVIPNGQSAPSQSDAVPVDINHALILSQQCLNEAVAGHPKTSLIAAASAGVILGWILKRR
jgi:hypothetical protein